MTAVSAAPPLQLSAGARLRAALVSEWTKTRSLRSTYWSLLGAVVAIIGLGVLFCVLYDVQHNFIDALTHPWKRSLHGVILAQIAVGVLGILAITGEFSTGMIRSTFTAVPQRLLILTAKAIVFPTIVLLVTTGASFAAFGIGQAVLSRDDAGASLHDPGVAHAVIGVGLYLTVLSLFSLALGTLIRHTAGAIATLFGILLVLPLLTATLPSPWNADVGKYLPGIAGLALPGISIGPASLSPWVGFAVFCGWTAGLLITAGWSLNRRDV